MGDDAPRHGRRRRQQFGLDVDDETIAGVAGLIRTSQQAMLEDRLAGIDTDHKQIVAFITRLIDDLERRAPIFA